jgi:hypothetical protein
MQPERAQPSNKREQAQCKLGNLTKVLTASHWINFRLPIRKLDKKSNCDLVQRAMLTETLKSLDERSKCIWR